MLTFKHEVRRTKAAGEEMMARLRRALLARRLETLMQEAAEINAEIARINQWLNAPGVS